MAKHDLSHLSQSRFVQDANEFAVSVLNTASAKLIGIRTASDAIPTMTKHTILHAGPPIAFENMCGAMKGAVIGALMFEGIAKKESDAAAIASSGDVEFKPCHHVGAVAPMSGIISASMPVFVVRNTSNGNLAYTPINEGPGRVLQHGANDSVTLSRLYYIKDEFAPFLGRLIEKCGGIDLCDILSQALHMGDEGHNRNKAATLLFLMKLLPYFIESDDSRSALAADFITSNREFFVNLSMAACKSMLDSARGIEGSTLVTAMSRNGVEFGIQISGMDGIWFTGPAQKVMGLITPPFTNKDAGRDLGDSAITETMGIGGFAMCTAPAIVQCIGGSAEDAIHASLRMYEITLSESSLFTQPADNFRGLPLGIDILKVVGKRILPIINTAISSKDPGVGQIGAGIVTPPMECFEKAAMAFYSTYQDRIE